MSLTFLHLISLLVFYTSVSVFIVSSRPIITHHQEHVATSPSPTALLLTTSDGGKFDVQLQVVLQSETIMQMIVDGGFSDEIVLTFSNITGETMAKVLEYCNKHVYYAGDGAGSNITAVDEIRAFDSQFVDVHYEKLFNLIQAANELKIKSLLDLTSQTVANMIKGKTPEEIRKLFNIRNDFTLEEEEEVRRENAWAFE